MSVVIRGMEMPKSCRDCGIEQDGFWCGSLDGYQNTRCFTNERREDCPLVKLPPHGRLIDSDALIAHCKEMQSIEWNNKASPYSWAYAYENFESDIEDAPTILDAEVEE